MGRWSREIAKRYVEWLDAPAGLDWLEIGCGTGALSATLLERCAPKALLGIDPSPSFVDHARASIADERARFEVGGADALPCKDNAVDTVVSALAYNFFPDRLGALAEMRRVTRAGGMVSFYVWDYPSGGMGFISAFWDVTTALDPDAAGLAEDRRFEFCNRDALLEELTNAGFSDGAVTPIEVTTRFANFDAFWNPFTLGLGPAPGYCMGLDEDARRALKHDLQKKLSASNGEIVLPARAWAVRGRA